MSWLTCLLRKCKQAVRLQFEGSCCAIAPHVHTKITAGVGVDGNDESGGGSGGGGADELLYEVPRQAAQLVRIVVAVAYHFNLSFFSSTSQYSVTSTKNAITALCNQ